MAGTILLRKYNVLKVLFSSGTINCYAASRNDIEDGKLFLINEICDRSLINKYITELIDLKKDNIEEFEEYFTEDSKLYVVFSYAKGESIDKLLKNEKYPFEYRVSLIQQIACRLTEYPSVSYFLKTMALFPQNIIFEENMISFNYRFFIYGDDNLASANAAYRKFGELIEVMFSESEIEKNTNLRIVHEKCQKGVYHSFGEIIKDLEDVLNIIDKDKGLKQIAEVKRKKTKGIIAKAAVFVVIVGCGVVVYQNINDKDVNTAVYTNTNAIGTVDLNEKDNDDNDYSKVYIDDAKKDGADENNTLPSQQQLSEEPKENTDEIPQEKPAEPTEEIDENALVDENGIPYQTYVIQRGDFLSRISKKFYGTDDYTYTLAEYNGISNPSLLNVGSEIKIPDIEKLANKEKTVSDTVENEEKPKSTLQ